MTRRFHKRLGFYLLELLTKPISALLGESGCWEIIFRSVILDELPSFCNLVQLAHAPLVSWPQARPQRLVHLQKQLDLLGRLPQANTSHL